jgi:hypothetical protein
MKSMFRMFALAPVLGLLASCVAASSGGHVTDDDAPVDPDAPNTDVEVAEVQLQAAHDDWRAALVHDNGDQGGVWVVKAFRVRPNRGQQDIVGLDAKGRLLLFGGYSGRWHPRETIHEGAWLNGLVHADLDDRVPGKELYTGGKVGNLWQVVVHREGGAIENRLIGRFPAERINILVAGDLRPDLPGNELAVFTAPGQLHLVTRDASAPGGFTSTHLQRTDSHSRDALLLPAVDGAPPTVANAAANGVLELLTFGPGGVTSEVLYRSDVGMGRLTANRPGPGTPLRIYTTCDDGNVLRSERAADGSWSTTVIYAGPIGPRGVAAGRFSDDPKAETIIIYGYSKVVELLTRTAKGPWKSEVIFEAKDKGHSLWTCELDGRNATDEVILAGYGKRIVQLFRPPGYGRETCPGRCRIPSCGGGGSAGSRRRGAPPRRRCPAPSPAGARGSAARSARALP